ncbi:ABC transporter ATP-binding protein [Natrinema halophilum]|uniref:ABC transporter ATP-binding protein n=1 Tax=Natrinema halophilum TaxID=1699371 RepID=A0A7D5KS19_9EURY|nr:ABC transporter ATP-binding protein [Natrinema halophilum]QLG49897.1 ABC transporter ATP-binding protein [Natrinema halophilum]
MTAIETTDLTKRFGDDILAVDGLDLHVDEGEVFGFLGPNGAGKSTTIDMLLDYVRPTDGTATVLGMDVHEDSAALRERIGVLPDGISLYDRLTGRRHIEFAIEWADAGDDPGAVLARVGLTESDAARPIGDYSKGMQQRLALGMALVGDPDLLILDEPTSGLDPHGIRELRELVRREAANGTTVFFSSHILDQVDAVCDRVGILYEGELVAVDTVEGLRTTVGAGSELRLRVAGDIDADVAATAGVDSVQLSGGILRVTCSDSRAKARVVTQLTNAGVDILDVDSEDASLEDVFTAYTSESNGLEPVNADPDGVREVIP